MGFPWKKVFSFGLAGLKVASVFLPAKAGTVTGLIVDKIHDIEDITKGHGLSGLQKFQAVFDKAVSGINELGQQAGKGDIVDDELRVLTTSAINANVALENAIAKRLQH